MAIAHARPTHADDPTMVALTPGAERALSALLQRARHTEEETSGPDRRRAFRNTRHLLGGMRALGIPIHVLADALDVTVRSARARAGSDGPIRLDDFRRLIGPSVARTGTDGRDPSHGQTLHPASTLIVAFLESITPSESGGPLPR